MKVHILFLLLIIPPILVRADNSTNQTNCSVSLKVTVQQINGTEGEVVYESSNVRVKRLVPYFMVSVMIVLGVFVVWKRPI